MGKGKLEKFADMESFPHVFQYPYGVLKTEGFDLKTKWRSSYFKNSHPIVLELGCGKGEYTVGLSKIFPEKNFIGIDIKGARMWTGAKQSFNEKLDNVAFVRTNIEMVDHFFGAAEVDEIWLTFPDPQMKKYRKRLTSTNFMERYRRLLSEQGIIHLKTDSNFQFTYTMEMIKANGFKVLESTDNLYGEGFKGEVLGIKTHYEQQWIERGCTIKYVKFQLHDRTFVEPDVEIEFDEYRSYNRTKSSPKTKGR